MTTNSKEYSPLNKIKFFVTKYLCIIPVSHSHHMNQGLHFSLKISTSISVFYRLYTSKARRPVFSFFFSKIKRKTDIIRGEGSYLPSNRNSPKSERIENTPLAILISTEQF